MPEGKSRTGSFDLLATRNKEVLHNILSHDFDSYHQEILGEDLPSPDKLLDRQNFNKVKSLYDSCMNETHIDSRGPEPLYPLLKAIHDIYPSEGFTATEKGAYEIQADAEVDQQQLTRALAYLSKNGVDALFGLFVDADPKEPEKTSLQIYQSGLTLPSKEYYTQEDMTSTLYDVVEETLDLVLSKMPDIGWNQYSAKTTARFVVDFEKKLANISDLPEYLMDPSKTYNPNTLSQLSKLSPKVDWGLLVTHLLPSTAPHQDVIIVSSPKYLEDLSAQILGDSTQRTIQAYLLWQAMNEYAPALSEEVRKPLQRLAAKLRGTNAKVTKPRWETCLDQVDYSLGFMAGRYFVMETFNKNTKARADEFVKSIKDSFVNRLPDLGWIDDVTRERAIEKVDTLVRKVGYPTKTPNVMAPVSLSDYYSELVMDSDNYFENYLRSRQWQVMKDWRQAGKPSDKSQWLMVSVRRSKCNL